MTYFQVGSGDVVGSAHMNTAINQGVSPFANAAARDAAIPSPTAGQCCYLLDLKQGQTWDSGWFPAWGKMPSGRAVWGAAGPATVGLARVASAPQTADARGGLVWDTTSNAFTIPVKGVYLIATRIYFSSAVAGAIYAATAGDLIVQTDVPFTSFADPVGSAVASAGMSTFDLDVGMKVGLWYQADAAANLSAGMLAVTWVSA
jgi:hypothetical protein